MTARYKCPCGKKLANDASLTVHIKTCEDFKQFVKETLEIIVKAEKLEKTYDDPGSMI